MIWWLLILFSSSPDLPEPDWGGAYRTQALCDARAEEARQEDHDLTGYVCLRIVAR